MSNWRSYVPTSKVTAALLGGAGGAVVVDLVETHLVELSSTIEEAIILAFVFIAGWWKKEGRPAVDARRVLGREVVATARARGREIADEVTYRAKHLADEIETRGSAALDAARNPGGDFDPGV